MWVYILRTPSCCGGLRNNYRRQMHRWLRLRPHIPISHIRSIHNPAKRRPLSALYTWTITDSIVKTILLRIPISNRRPATSIGSASRVFAVTARRGDIKRECKICCDSVYTMVIRLIPSVYIIAKATNRPYTHQSIG